jgi:hypothetical protein
MTMNTSKMPAKLGEGGLVDRAKFAQYSLLDRFLPQRFVFHHVPKCGGISVGRALRKRYLPSQATVLPEASFRAFDEFYDRSDTEQMLVDVLDLREQILLYLMFADTRCVSAHCGFPILRFYSFATATSSSRSFVIRWHGSCPTIAGATSTLVLTPRSRRIFDTFLNSTRAQRMGATYVEYFARRPKDADIRTPEAGECASANLRCSAVIGRLENLAGFTDDIREQLGFRIRIGHENRSPGPGGGIKAAGLTVGQRQKVHDLCAPDLAVWENFS